MPGIQDFTWARHTCVGSDCVAMSVVTYSEEDGGLVLMTGLAPDCVPGWDGLVDDLYALRWDSVRAKVLALGDGDRPKRVPVRNLAEATERLRGSQLSGTYRTTVPSRVTPPLARIDIEYDSASMGWKFSRPDWESSSIGVEDVRLVVEDAVTALEQRHARDWGRTALVAFVNEREMTVGEWRKATAKLDVAEFPWCVIQREADTTWCVYALCKSRDVADALVRCGQRTPDRPPRAFVVPVDGATDGVGDSPRDIGMLVLESESISATDIGTNVPVRVSAITNGCLSGIRDADELHDYAMAYRGHPGNPTGEEIVATGERDEADVLSDISGWMGHNQTRVSLVCKIRFVSDRTGDIDDYLVIPVSSTDGEPQDAIERYSKRNFLRGYATHRDQRLSDVGEQGHTDVYVERCLTFLGLPVKEEPLMGARFPMQLYPVIVRWAQREDWGSI